MPAIARVAGLALAPFAAQAATAQAPSPPDPAIVARGNAVYAGTCAGCWTRRRPGWTDGGGFMLRLGGLLLLSALCLGASASAGPWATYRA